MCGGIAEPDDTSLHMEPRKLYFFRYFKKGRFINSYLRIIVTGELEALKQLPTPLCMWYINNTIFHTNSEALEKYVLHTAIDSLFMNK